MAGVQGKKYVKAVVFARLMDDYDNGKKIKCPRCGSEKLECSKHSYEDDSGRGFIVFHCPDCGGIDHFSGIQM